MNNKTQILQDKDAGINFESFLKTSVIRALSLDEYTYLRDNLRATDVSKNSEYQTRFNAFFRVRRNEEWRKKYYSYFEKVKNKDVSFEDILTNLYKNTGNIEASFASKMLAIINPNMPVWDQFVLKNLKLKVEGTDTTGRLQNTIEVYNRIIELENQLCLEKNSKLAIKEFRKMFPDYNLSDIKILDYYLWSNRHI